MPNLPSIPGFCLPYTWAADPPLDPIQWSRNDRNQPFTYTTLDGQALVLEQGTSYICIMDPDQSKLTIPEPELPEASETSDAEAAS